ncbi:MAG: methyltransferase family protein [Vicinamibacterales bacterium]
MRPAGAADLGVLLSEIGIQTARRRRAAGVLLIAAFEISFIGLALAQAFIEYRLGLSPVIVVAIVWAVWTWWHSWVFPRNRLRHLRRAHAYRAAFVRDIYPWVTLGFCQMWRPLVNGDTLAKLLPAPPVFLEGLSPVAIVAGAVMSLATLVMMISAIRSIGIANAAFVPEFRDPGAFVPVQRGIYAHFMHPLFWSGALFSTALAIAISTPVARAIAGVNLAYSLLYGPLESRRLRRVFGPAYAAYAAQVPSLPVPMAWRKKLSR